VVEVTFRRDSRQRLSSVFASGHAEFGAFPDDVVCAAVSAILQAAYAGLEDVARVRLRGARRRAGDLAFTIPEDDRDRLDVHAIVATAELSLHQLERQYPGHVRVESATES
jgi:uncharacterized protein YsxB (DUF464 family)